MIKRAQIRQKTINSLSSDSVEHSISSYMLVDKRVLNIDTKINFQLYTRDEYSRMRLFLQSDSVIDEHDKKTLQVVEDVFAKKTDRNKYDAFLENNIQNILQDDTLTIEEKTDIIYESSSDLTHSLFKNPNALKNAKRSENIVSPVLESILYHGNTVSSYMKIIEYDYYTHTHSLNVSIYTLCLGAFLKLSEDKLKKLGKAALLHDLGKSGVDPDIVNKPAKLTPEEFETMKSHPSFGYVTALNIGIDDQDILDGIHHHHEKLNGHGYPDGLKGDEIKLFPRLIGVCDVFDALTTNRSYKVGMTSFVALSLMKNEMHEHLDMDIVNSFIKMLRK